jgi:hypothetical protein
VVKRATLVLHESGLDEIMLEMQNFSADCLRLKDFIFIMIKINEQLKLEKWLAVCLSLFCFNLRTEGVKGEVSSPLTSA